MKNKLYYKIGEVAKIFDINTSVIRFWEKEFPQLRPIKSSSGQRNFDAKNLDLLRVIHKLMHVELKSINETKAIIQDKNAVANLIDQIRSEELESQHNKIKEIGFNKEQLKIEIKSIIKILTVNT